MLVVEVPADRFDALAGEERLDAPIERVVVRQQGGMLEKGFRCRWVECIGPLVAQERGLPDGRPALAIWLAEPEKGAGDVRH
jgi:hypothetical protein